MNPANSKILSSSILNNKKIVLGVCGSIAAYKVPELVRALSKQGADVTCVLTYGGSRFITALTLSTVSRNKVYEGMFDSFEPDIEHISLSKKADIIVVVPATADAIARFACGRAEDLLSSVILATVAPILICPAMNEKMWLHPATKRNVGLLKEFGYHFVPPAKGELACGSIGDGRLADLETIEKEIKKVFDK